MRAKDGAVPVAALTKHDAELDKIFNKYFDALVVDDGASKLLVSRDVFLEYIKSEKFGWIRVFEVDNQ